MSNNKKQKPSPRPTHQQIPIKTVSFDDQGRPGSPLGPDDFFDDCPICQATKKAYEENRDVTLSELEAAFRQAKELGIGQVGTQEDLVNEGPTPHLGPDATDPWFDEIDSWTEEEMDEFLQDQEKRVPSNS
jgi:hypothetical protein